MITREVFEKIQVDKANEKLRKEQYRHEWKLAIFNACAGGIAGLITSIIFWLITK